MGEPRAELPSTRWKESLPVLCLQTESTSPRQAELECRVFTQDSYLGNRGGESSILPAPRQPLSLCLLPWTRPARPLRRHKFVLLFHMGENLR